VINVPLGVLSAILTEAERLSGTSADDMSVTRAEPVVWSDGSLGCPEPGMFYTQVLVNGYWVVVQAGDETYDFRVDGSGNFKLCPPGSGTPPIDTPDRY